MWPCLKRLQGAGYVGLYRQGSTRALAKLKYAKESPWRFGLNREAFFQGEVWRFLTFGFMQPTGTGL